MEFLEILPFVITAGAAIVYAERRVSTLEAELKSMEKRTVKAEEVSENLVQAMNQNNITLARLDTQFQGLKEVLSKIEEKL